IIHGEISSQVGFINPCHYWFFGQKKIRFISERFRVIILCVEGEKYNIHERRNTDFFASQINLYI
ncbi:hypothetical protein ACXOM3_09495, partial [Streptococcus thermophilus]